MKADDIDDHIDRWHEESVARDSGLASVSDFLGMTREEHEAWLHNPSVFPQIICARLSRAS